MSKTTCPGCGKGYEALGKHWRFTPSHRPSFTDKQCEIVTGLMMGDGSISMKEKGNPRLKVKMIAKKYLEYLDRAFGIIGTGVKFEISAKNSAKNAKETGFSPNAKAENYSDKYRWRTRSHPELAKWDWYTGPDRKKKFPESIELTPTILKHWYCCDGSLAREDGASTRMTISCSNERRNEEKIDKYFEDARLPQPDRYVYQQFEEYKDGMNIWFDSDKTKEIFKYMGSPLPGFDYKWLEVS